MVVKKKIEQNDDIRYSVISNGGSVKEDGQSEIKWEKITLRISDDMLKEIKRFLSRRPGLTRNAWILEAINDKFGENYE